MGGESCSGNEHRSVWNAIYFKELLNSLRTNKLNLKSETGCADMKLFWAYQKVTAESFHFWTKLKIDTNVTMLKVWNKDSFLSKDTVVNAIEKQIKKYQLVLPTDVYPRLEIWLFKLLSL